MLVLCQGGFIKQAHYIYWGYTLHEVECHTARSMTVLGFLVLIPLCGGERACRVGVVAAQAAYLFYAPTGATTPGTYVPAPP